MQEEKIRELVDLQSRVAQCQKCHLHTTRTTTVFGEGNPNAELMFIGEGPGRDEDLQGRPFIGRAGQLLTRLIEKGMKVARDEVFIANVIKCRATENLAGFKDRAPDVQEVAACSPYLLAQIQIIQPKVIVALGNPASKFILRTEKGITQTRGNWAEFMGIPVMPTYHPSYVLRRANQQIRQDIWSDLMQVMAKLNWPIQTSIRWK